MSDYRIPKPEGIPEGLHSVYGAQAVRDAEARSKAESERIEAERQKRKDIADSLAKIDRENEQRRQAELEAKQKRDEEAFEASLRDAYFEANPGASEIDWLRDKKTLKSQAMIQRTLERLGEGDAKTIMKRRIEYDRY